MRRLLPGMAALFVACAHHPPAPVRPVLVDAAGHEITLPRLVAQTGGVSYFLIGEEHDNNCDHAWEGRLVSALTGARPAVVGLEMVALDQQPVLDRFNASQLAVDQLDHSLDWEKRWGFPFALYRPIFAAAREHGAPVIALNVPKEVEHAVGAGGLESLTPAQREGVTPKLIPPPPEEEAMLRSAMAGHHATPNWDRFVRVQSLWDTQMAFRAAEAHQRSHRPVIVIAGGGHVEHGWGIAYRLRQLDPGASVLSVMPLRPGEHPDPTEADVFFVCPSAH